MSITEEQRHRLIRALERELGEEEAAALMELVPKVAWADLATRRDVEHVAADLEHVAADVGHVAADLQLLAADIDRRFGQQDALWRAELGRLEARMDARIGDAVNRLTFRLLPAMATMIAIFGTIAALF